MVFGFSKAFDHKSQSKCSSQTGSEPKSQRCFQVSVLSLTEKFKSRPGAKGLQKNLLHFTTEGPFVRKKYCLIVIWSQDFLDPDVAIPSSAAVFDVTGAKQQERLFLRNAFIYLCQIWWNDSRHHTEEALQQLPYLTTWGATVRKNMFFCHYSSCILFKKWFFFSTQAFCDPDIRTCCHFLFWDRIKPQTGSKPIFRPSFGQLTWNLLWGLIGPLIAACSYTIVLLFFFTML